MIEETTTNLLANYGVLGLWTITLLADKFHYRKKGMEDKKLMEQVIKENTQVMASVREALRNVRR